MKEHVLDPAQLRVHKNARICRVLESQMGISSAYVSNEKTNVLNFEQVDEVDSFLFFTRVLLLHY